MKKIILILGLISAPIFAATFPNLANQASPADGDFFVGYRGGVDSRFQLSVLWSAYLKAKADAVYSPIAHTHAASALTQSGATTGQVLTWNGSAWVPATPTTGSGDMAKTTYDTGNNGIVDLAEVATVANSVSWTNVASKPLARIATYYVSGGGSTITAGNAAYVIIKAPCTITRWYLSGDSSGSITIDVAKRTPPATTYTSIVASAPPTLTSQLDANSTGGTLSWSPTTLAIGDVLKFTVTGTPVTVQSVSLLLDGTE